MSPARLVVPVGLLLRGVLPPAPSPRSCGGDRRDPHPPRPSRGSGRAGGAMHPGQAPPRVLVSLLWLAWTLSRAGSQSTKAQAPKEVLGFLGASVTLPCHLQLLETNVQVTQVTWEREQPTAAGGPVAVFHPTRGPMLQEPQRLGFLAARIGGNLTDASLNVTELRAEDEDRYTCHFSTFPTGGLSASTQLRVLASPSSKAEIQKNPLGQVAKGPVTVACCNATGGRPPAQISWSSSDINGNASDTQVPGLLPGTVNVISLFRVVPSSQVDGKTITCTVKHETFAKPVLWSMNLSVYYPPEVSISGYDEEQHAGHSEVTLTCDARSNPVPTGYVWNTTSGPLPPCAVAQDSQLLITAIGESVNTTFICHATNAMGTRIAMRTVLLRGGPAPTRWRPALVIMLVILIFLVLSVVALLMYFHRRLWHCCQHHSSPSVNGVRYSPGVQDSSPQGIPAEGTR